MLYEYRPDIIDKCRIEVELKDNWNFSMQIFLSNKRFSLVISMWDITMLTL